jgi:hypothetical protein
VPDLAELLGRLDALERDDERTDLAAAVEHAVGALTGGFEDLAVVRGGTIQLIALRKPGGTRMLVAATASESDRATLLARLRRDQRVLTIAAEILGLALVIPGEPLTLARRTRRIVELGQQLLAAAQ